MLGTSGVLGVERRFCKAHTCVQFLCDTVRVAGLR